MENENRRFIKIKDNDNVAIALSDSPKGTAVCGETAAIEDIPQAHKAALEFIPKGGEIRRYGVVLGYALCDIQPGQRVSETMLRLPASPALDSMPFAKNIVRELPKPTHTLWNGYDDPNGGFAGTRNLLGIHTTVQCVSGVLDAVSQKMRSELLPKYPNVDDIVTINHAYGCGVAINAREAEIPIRSLRNLIKHPNFGGQIMLVGLGCEKLTPDMLLDAKDNNADNVLILQDCAGFDAMADALMEMAERKLKELDKRRRTPQPLSKLLIGMQCGGSDAFSGVTANPAAGYAADMLVCGGGSVMFSEVTEIRDAVHLVAERCVNEETCKKLAGEMRWYDSYLDEGGVDRSANPTPGNKKGGLSNIVEKAMGSVAKSGSSPVVEVLSPGERPSKRGLIFAATPASDMVCGPCQAASGIGLQVFMTGRGTPYGLALLPVIKVSSRTELWERWKDLIDVNAGVVATGEATIAELGTRLFEEILDVAQGKKSCAEKYRLHNFMCVFNPAPIT